MMRPTNRLGLAGLAATVALAALPGHSTGEQRSPPFQVALPPGVTTVYKEGPDFDLFYFNRGDQTLAGAYVGFAPQFNPVASGGQVQQKVNCQGSTVLNREILLVIKRGNGQDYVHAWTAKLSDADRQTAEAILRSINWPGVNPGFGSTPFKVCP